MNINEQANFIWSIADLLRGDFKQSEYGKVILPFTVLRRFDCVLATSKAKILEANKTLTVSNKRPIFKCMTGHDYYNISQFLGEGTYQVAIFADGHLIGSRGVKF